MKPWAGIAGSVGIGLGVLGAGGMETAVGAGPRPGWPARLTLAILPYQPAPHLFDMWNPVAERLARRTGLPVRLTVPRVFEEYLEEVLAEEPDLAFFHPLQYLTARRRGGYDALTGPSQRVVGRLVVRADGPIRTVADLRGKTVGLLPPGALPGNLQVRMLLLDHGLVAGRDYAVVEVANHDLAILGVIAGRFAAAATGVAPVDALPAQTRSQIRILAETPPLSPVVIAAHPRLPPDLREVVSAALVGLVDDGDGRAILARLGWRSFVRVRDADFDVTRDFARRLGLGD